MPKTGSWDLPTPRYASPPEIRPGAHTNKRLSPRGQAVLGQLEDLFLAEGFTRFTVGDLAARLRCSLRTLYDLAPSREELVVVVLDRMLQRLGHEAEEEARRQHARIDQLYTYMNVVGQGLGRSSAKFTVDMQQTPAVQRVFDAHGAYAILLIQALIERAVVEGQFRPVHAGFAAELLAAALRCVIEPGSLASNGLTIGEALQEIARLFSHGLLGDSHGRALDRPGSASPPPSPR